MDELALTSCTGIIPRMLLSKRTILALEDERRRLRRQLSSLEQLLADAKSEADGVDGNGHDESLADTMGADSRGSNGSFAADVRMALKQIGKIASSSEVVRQMILSGLIDESDKRLNRVSVELFRSAKKGIGGVRKVSRGRYRIES